MYREINNYQVFYEKKDTAQGNAASAAVRYVSYKVYRGINNYQVFYEKKDTAQGNATSAAVR